MKSRIGGEKAECPTCFDEGRKSLAREISETLRSRGYWSPGENTGSVSDLIGAVAQALQENLKVREALETLLYLVGEDGLSSYEISEAYEAGRKALGK